MSNYFISIRHVSTVLCQINNFYIIVDMLVYMYLPYGTGSFKQKEIPASVLSTFLSTRLVSRCNSNRCKKPEETSLSLTISKIVPSAWEAR